MDRQLFWLDCSQRDIWRDKLSKLPHDKRDVYYDPDYVRLYEGDNDSANCYIYEKKGDIYIYPFIMHSIPQIDGFFDISTPYGYGGPVFSTEDPVFLNEAYQCFYEEALRRNIIAEVVKFHPLLNNHLPLRIVYKGNIMKMCPVVYVDMDIEEGYRWRKTYTYANRKNINKAERNNIGVKISQDDESWKAFKFLYGNTMKANKAAESYFFSAEYFKSIQSELADSYILASCTDRGKIISSMLVLLGKVYAHCHLIGTDRRFIATGVNNLLHHELILWCKKNGYKKLHIGGGRGNSNNDSLLRFKKNFSDKIAAFYVGEHVLNPEIYNELCMEWSSKNPGRQSSNRLLKYRL